MDSTKSKGHPALTDVQTGLPNALHWDTVFGVVFAAGDRGIPLTLLLLEIDHYSAWASGNDPTDVDRALASLGVSLATTTRSSDLAARVEESRFAFILVDCNMAGGRLVADRLDSLLNPLRQEAGVSFSMGVAVYNREMLRSEQLVRAAETALRAAQIRGGNQIEFQ